MRQAQSRQVTEEEEKLKQHAKRFLLIQNARKEGNATRGYPIQFTPGIQTMNERPSRISVLIPV